ncbi:MAG TPA: hypothetical protein VIA18_13485 [Polyangia bacterium]|jgi:hypothetical protein|nr:hypothetical protein [Polyangia bacterium]HWE27797.1 hypothetical protein [Polyangia bacterium]
MLTSAELTKTCVLAMSCLAVPEFVSGSACAAELEDGIGSGEGTFAADAADLTRLMACAASSNDCTSILACYTRNHVSDYCSTHNATSCDGDLLVGCFNGYGLLTRDCTKSGTHCAEANGAATCSDGKACDSTTPSRCDGNSFTTCDTTTNLESKIDCGTVVSNGVCDATIGCTPPLGAACTANACTSDTVGFECGSGRQVPVDCSAFGEKCASVQAQETSPCVATSSQCDGTMDLCSTDGTSMQICVNGAWVTTACSSIGLTSCGTTDGVVACH